MLLNTISFPIIGFHETESNEIDQSEKQTYPMKSQFQFSEVIILLINLC